MAEADSGSYNCAATGANISASSDPAELTVSSMYNYIGSSLKPSCKFWRRFTNLRRLTEQDDIYFNLSIDSSSFVLVYT